MGAEKTTNRGMRGFTLIELLVVISIIALLLAILMPSLQAAKGQAKSVLCSANQKQIGLYCTMFELDNGYLPFRSWTNGRWTFVSMLMGSEEGKMGITIPWTGAPYDLCPDEYNSTNYLEEPGAFKVFSCPANKNKVSIGGPDPNPDGSRVMWDQNLTYGIHQNFLLNSADKWSEISRVKPSKYKNPSRNAFLSCSDRMYSYIDNWRAYYDPFFGWGNMGGFHPKFRNPFLYMDCHVERYKVPVAENPATMPPDGDEILRRIGWLGW